MTTVEFVSQHREADVASLALQLRRYPEVDAAFALQQIEGWQRARHKLPELAANPDWHWPRRLSLEQASSETTARYKQQVLASPDQSEPADFSRLIDLTGGLGVDTFYLSELFAETHYVERDEALCALAEHNFAATGRRITVHHCQAEDWLANTSPGAGEVPAGRRGLPLTTIFLDPARRDSHGGKVFRLQDCTPDVTELLPQMQALADRILIKLSPMLDITEALRALGGAAEVHVVAVRNEVKELLVLLKTGQNTLDPQIVCVNLETQEPAFRFRASEEKEADRFDKFDWSGKSDWSDKSDFFLVEPNAAILKAGAFKTFAARFGLTKLAANTQLYAICSQAPSKNIRIKNAFSDLPGRLFEVHEAEKEELKQLKQANVLCRNYPLAPEALKKKLRLSDGGETYVIGARVGDKPTLFVGRRQIFHT